MAAQLGYESGTSKFKKAQENTKRMGEMIQGMTELAKQAAAKKESASG